ncbi:hypothetical protein HMPREF0762_01848 [Slackia exigua ATCC 700122]|uniref:Uncharacterized protein n=1 Tax=Slackia exigua (strain ATCC 700122 / DSM 15923 / CIP 105133 / JCM 11022 / KCTC 5966 / S-7) TaxID=649764 RepID=D0WJ23_SLAES|nr:hypothetical protein HMPREF0762_01848 [Slackia exigua ATCC 700122]
MRNAAFVPTKAIDRDVRRPGGPMRASWPSSLQDVSVSLQGMQERRCTVFLGDAPSR